MDELLKQSFKKAIYEFGTTPNHFDKIGLLIHRDLHGECGGLIMFDKKTIQEAVDIIVDEIVISFTEEVMLNLINNCKLLKDDYSITYKNDEYILKCGSVTFHDKYKEIVLWKFISRFILILIDNN